jgi:hypothetical protein
MSRPDATPEAIQRFVIHYTLLHFVVKKQVGFARTLEALRFPVSSIQLPEFGNLPVTMISAPISTTRPPDDVVNENTEISGVNVFEEIVNLEDLTRMRDPFRDQLAKIVQGFGEDLLDDRPHSIGA